VAGLIAETRGNLERARDGVRGQRKLDADGESLFEHRQRLIDADLLEIDGSGKDDLGHRDAWRRINRELSRDQVWIARFVGLNVKALGKRDRQRAANRLAGMRAIGVEQRRDLRFDPLQLGTNGNSENPENCENPENSSPSHFTSLSGITATGSGGSDVS